MQRFVLCPIAVATQFPMPDYEIDNDKPQVVVRIYGTSIFVLMFLLHCLNVVRARKRRSQHSWEPPFLTILNLKDYHATLNIESFQPGFLSDHKRTFVFSSLKTLTSILEGTCSVSFTMITLLNPFLDKPSLVLEIS